MASSSWRGGGGKGRITPKVTYDRVELDLPLIGSRDADQDRSGPKRGLRGGRARVASRVATPQPQSLNRRKIKRLRTVPTNRCRTSNSVLGCRRLSMAISASGRFQRAVGHCAPTPVAAERGHLAERPFSSHHTGHLRMTARGRQQSKGDESSNCRSPIVFRFSIVHAVDRFDIYFFDSQGLITSTFKSEKCRTFLVANFARRAITIPAIWVSRISTVNPSCCRLAASSAAASAAG